ncbi:hypothetical protein [Neoaquamicrobium sediminum]|uniref:hypothetical protein n=1 Tax=Neoaquamicrobium sediminum TaxID=1849104 RepID=UPI004035A763
MTFTLNFDATTVDYSLTRNNREEELFRSAAKVCFNGYWYDVDRLHDVLAREIAVNIILQERSLIINATDIKHPKNLLKAHATGFVCPCCKRSATECLWKPKTDGKWMMRVDGHHDHSPNERFEITPLCCNCNSFERHLRERLKLSSEVFSFSPDELQWLVPQKRPHMPHGRVPDSAVEKARKCLEYNGIRPPWKWRNDDGASIARRRMSDWSWIESQDLYRGRTRHDV